LTDALRIWRVEIALLSDRCQSAQCWGSDGAVALLQRRATIQAADMGVFGS
jgi:hypothetical protein